MMDKITCNVIKDMLPLYVDGAVCEDTKKIVEDHLEGCNACKNEMNKLTKALIIPITGDIQKEDANVLKNSIYVIEKNILKKFIHYASYFDLIFNLGMIPIIYCLYVFWIKKEFSLLNIYTFLQKYGRMSGDLLSFALLFVIFIICDFIHIIITRNKKSINIVDSMIVMSIVVKLFVLFVLMAFLTVSILM